MYTKEFYALLREVVIDTLRKEIENQFPNTDDTTLNLWIENLITEDNPDLYSISKSITEVADILVKAQKNYLK